LLRRSYRLTIMWSFLCWTAWLSWSHFVANCGFGRLRILQKLAQGANILPKLDSPLMRHSQSCYYSLQLLPHLLEAHKAALIPRDPGCPKRTMRHHIQSIPRSHDSISQMMFIGLLRIAGSEWPRCCIRKKRSPPATDHQQDKCHYTRIQPSSLPTIQEK
jgi:hypothetical protein